MKTTRRSELLGLLPSVYARDDEAQGVLGRFLLAFEDVLTHGYRRDHRGRARRSDSDAIGETVAGIEQLIDRLPRFFDPRTTPHRPQEPRADFLAWIFSELGLEWYDDLEEPELRRLLAQAVGELFPLRGTAEGIRRYLQLVAYADEVRIEENRWPTNMQIGRASTIGRDSLLSDRGTKPRAHCFLVHVSLRWDRIRRYCDSEAGRATTTGEFRRVLARRVHQILRRERPAHTLSLTRIRVTSMQLGCGSTIGLDSVLA